MRLPILPCFISAPTLSLKIKKEHLLNKAVVLEQLNPEQVEVEIRLAEVPGRCI